MELVSVAAVAENRVIGAAGEVPWELPADTRQYRTRIADAPVILGRRTFESMLDDLPGRAQIVLSRSNREYDVEAAFTVGSVEAAIDIAASLGAETAYVIGGADIYSLFQPHVDRMILSHVPGRYEGDAYYPAWDPDEWTVVSTQEYEGFTLKEWRRVDATGSE